MQGTLDLLILRSLVAGEMHGLGISRRIRQITGGTFVLKPGSLFPALHRMEEEGWISAFWGDSENNRRAKYYRLTKAGQKQLQAETKRWGRISGAIAQALEASYQGASMPFFVRVRSLLRNLFLSRRVDKDLDEEVHAHLEMLKDESVRADMPPKEAERSARIELGGIEQVKEQVRDERIGSWLHSVLSDYRFGLRQLRKNPGFTAIAILTLALGIGFSTTVFSIFYNGVLYPFPYRDAGRLTVIGIVDTQHNSMRRKAEQRIVGLKSPFCNPALTGEDSRC